MAFQWDTAPLTIIGPEEYAYFYDEMLYEQRKMTREKWKGRNAKYLKLFFGDVAQNDRSRDPFAEGAVGYGPGRFPYQVIVRQQAAGGGDVFERVEEPYGDRDHENCDRCDPKQNRRDRPASPRTSWPIFGDALAGELAQLFQTVDSDPGGSRATLRFHYFLFQTSIRLAVTHRRWQLASDCREVPTSLTENKFWPIRFTIVNNPDDDDMYAFSHL